MPQTLLHLCQCPSCEAGVILGAIDTRTECRHCQYRFLPHNPTVFGRRQWDAEQNPELLAACLWALGRASSPRKRRLVFCGLARTAFDWCKNFWFREAVELAEQWADHGPPAV